MAPSDILFMFLVTPVFAVLTGWFIINNSDGKD